MFLPAVGQHTAIRNVLHQEIAYILQIVTFVAEIWRHSFAMQPRNTAAKVPSKSVPERLVFDHRELDHRQPSMLFTLPDQLGVLIASLEIQCRPAGV